MVANEPKPETVSTPVQPAVAKKSAPTTEQVVASTSNVLRQAATSAEQFAAEMPYKFEHRPPAKPDLLPTPQPVAEMNQSAAVISETTAVKPLISLNSSPEASLTTTNEYLPSLPEPIAESSTETVFDWGAFDTLIAPNYDLLQVAPSDEIYDEAAVEGLPEDELQVGADLALAYDWLGLTADAEPTEDAEASLEAGSAVADIERAKEIDLTARTAVLSEQIDQQLLELEPAAAELIDQTLQQLAELIYDFTELIPANTNAVAEVLAIDDDAVDKQNNALDTLIVAQPEITAQKLAVITELCVTLLEQLQLPTDETTIHTLIALMAPELAELFAAPDDNSMADATPSDEGTHEILLEGMVQGNDDGLTTLVDQLKVSWYGSIASRQLAA